MPPSKAYLFQVKLKHTDCFEALAILFYSGILSFLFPFLFSVMFSTQIFCCCCFNGKLQVCEDFLRVLEKPGGVKLNGRLSG